MRRTLAIVFAADLAGGAAGAAVGIAVDGGHSSAPTLHEARIVARPTSVVRTDAALSHEAISQVVAPTFFTQMVDRRFARTGWRPRHGAGSPRPGTARTFGYEPHPAGAPGLVRDAPGRHANHGSTI